MAKQGTTTDKAVNVAGAKAKPRGDRAQTTKTTKAPRAARAGQSGGTEHYGFRPIRRGTMHRR